MSAMEEMSDIHGDRFVMLIYHVRQKYKCILGVCFFDTNVTQQDKSFLI